MSGVSTLTVLCITSLFPIASSFCLPGRGIRLNRCETRVVVRDKPTAEKSSSTILQVSSPSDEPKSLGELLDSIEEDYKQTENVEKTRAMKRKLIAINSEIDSLAYKCNVENIEYAQDAENMLLQLIEDSKHGDIKPSARSFSSVIKAYTNARNPEKAEAILKLLIEYSKNLDHSGFSRDDELCCRPNTIIFTNVINAWSQSSRKNAAKRADEILDWMKQMSKAGIPGVAPNSVTYATCINAWSNGKKVTEKCALRAEELLEEMEIERASGNPHVVPNKVAFTSVINAWGRSKSPRAVERIEYIFERMLELYKEGDEDVKPNNLTFNSVMSAYVKNNIHNAASMTEKLLNKMDAMALEGDVEVEPDTISFNVCINAWARSDDSAAAQYAEHLLTRLETRYKEKNNKRQRPNDRSYNTVINAWVKSKSKSSTERAENILHRMIEASNDGNQDARPNVISFSTVMDAWAKSNDPSKSRKAQAMLQKMVSLYEDGNKLLKPNNIAYNTVLNACAFNKNGDKDDSLLVAISTFNELRNSQYCQPDAVTYGTLLKAFNYLVPKGDKLTMMATKLFYQCRKEGLFGDLFLNGMRKALPRDTFTRLMEEGGVEWSKGDLRPPKEWIRNVKDKRSIEAARKKHPRGTSKEKDREKSHHQQFQRKFVPQISINVGGIRASEHL